MIKEVQGNLLAADVDALVNTVNTVGVMGKGIALQFKKAYPDMFRAYQAAAKAGDLRIGHMHVWETGLLSGPRFIVNFPTKKHWRQPSRLEEVADGLQDLKRVVRELGITSIALPPLGCGNGGLNWREVEPLIREAFADAPDVDVLLFPPSGAPAAVAIKPTPMPPTMTPGRAALVALIRQYTDQSWNPPGLIETQKLMYFLQVAGEPLRLHFAANRYGPYADNLRHVLTAVEGHYLSGFGDGSAHVTQAEPLRVMPGAIEEATAVLASHSQTSERIDHVLELATGFESAYGLELLATVHWLADRAEQEERRSDDLVVRQVADWSPRKAKMFTDRHIRIALERLRAQSWLAGSGATVEDNKHSAREAQQNPSLPT